MKTMHRHAGVQIMQATSFVIRRGWTDPEIGDSFMEGVRFTVALDSLMGHNRTSDSLSGTPMPIRDRWPLVSVSITGVAPEMWDAFEKKAKDQGLTNKDAMEASIRRFAEAVRSGRPVTWPAPRTGKRRAVQMHHLVREEMRALIREFGYRQNVVILAAMQQWLDKKSD
jgi:hypothetical protein